MERFTKKVDGVWTALCNYGSSPYPVVTQEIIDRLAAYEDTGLTPEEVQQMRWIPVEERLPVAQGEYIVTACDEGCPYGEGIWYSTVVVVADYYKGCWTWDDYRCEYDISDIVTHWMPLPSRQRRKRNEQDNQRQI